MESSHSHPKICGDSKEECESSESGWTMYIGSPSHTDDARYEQSEDENDSIKQEEEEEEEEEESDDSMASDASSGPSHRGQFSWRSGQSASKDKKKLVRSEKAMRVNPAKKNEDERKKLQEKEEPVYTAEGANKGSIQNSSTVRKGSYFGKRK
ncbi:hypothetical protein NMG60_11023985 [Bertholletia excelsa]